MIVYLILFLFFLVSGIQLLRGKFQWMIPDNDEEDKRDLKRRDENKSIRSRAVGWLFLFCSVCILLVGAGSVLQLAWLSRLVAAIMFLLVLVGLVFISTSNKLRK